MTLLATAACEQGQRNAENQDAYLIHNQRGIFAVCDGMGGHAGGQIASQSIIRHLQDTLQTVADHLISVAYLMQRIEYANQSVYTQAKQQLELRGMGSTLVLAWITDNQLHLFHVGDSRAYRLRDYRLRCLTRDHTGKQGRGVSRAVGVKPAVDIEYQCLDWQPQDRLILTSDGISDVVPDFRLTNALVDSSKPMVIQAAQLLGTANAAGGLDDKTVVLIQQGT
jgi:protein phosphatase